MSSRKLAVKETKSLAGKSSKPTFGKTAKKSEPDNLPRPMGGGKQPGGLAKKLKGRKI